MKTNMGFCKFVFLVTTACIFSACSSASVPEAPVKPMMDPNRSARLGHLNRYFLTTWEQEVWGSGMEVVPNNAAGIAALTLTGTEKVIIIVHGRESGIFNEFVDDLKKEILTADRDMIVILVDWSLVSHLQYQQAAAAVPLVADDLANFIALMVQEARLQLDMLHLVGFDLGAHIVGIASRRPNARARKITALSPAGQNWGWQSLRLRPTDAQFVEVIHTNAFGNQTYGIGEAIGTIDFFANGGGSQPGCNDNDNWCHHDRAWQLFKASVEVGDHRGHRCENMAQLQQNRCNGLSATMGTLELTKIATGLYRVNTGRKYPYNILGAQNEA